jgi:hypothetical protein
MPAPPIVLAQSQFALKLTAQTRNSKQSIDLNVNLPNNDSVALNSVKPPIGKRNYLKREQKA